MQVGFSHAYCSSVKSLAFHSLELLLTLSTQRFLTSWEDNCECGFPISWSQTLLSFSFASGAAACSHPQHPNVSRAQGFPCSLEHGLLWLMSCLGGDVTWRKCREGGAWSCGGWWKNMRGSAWWRRKTRIMTQHELPHTAGRGSFTLTPVRQFSWSWFSHICLNGTAWTIGCVMIIFITVMSGLVQDSFCSKPKNLENCSFWKRHW